MEITKIILSKLKDNEIYNYILNEISYIYDKYHYLSISSEVMDKIIYDEIALSRKNYKDNGDYKNYLKNRIEGRIIGLGTKILDDSNLACQVIDKYIKESFSLPDSYMMARNYLKKLSNLFSSFSYIPEPITIINLINNNALFSKILEMITFNHLNYFDEYSPFQLFNDNNIASLIDIYCMIKNIKTEDKYLEKDDGYITNSLGEYFNEIDAIPPISSSEMQELGKRIKFGDEAARNRLTEGNLKLVVSIAKAFYKLNNSVSIQDLIDAGNIGLMKAASKYDIDLGFRFSTYAKHWIRVEIIREIQNNGRTIRIPIAIHEKINAYNQLKEKLIQQKQTEISYQEIAKLMNISIDKVMEYERMQEPIISLNSYLNDEEDTEIQDMIGVDDFDLEINASNDDIHKLFLESGLTDKQTQILLFRYGFLDGATRTLEEIGRMFGVKKQAIAQQEARALYKLRTCEGIKKFVEYMDCPEKALAILERFKVIYREKEESKNKFNPLEESTSYHIVKIR